MAQQHTIQKTVSPIKVTLIMILVVSLLYPLFFAYIDKEYKLQRLAVELVFTSARLSGIAFLSHGIIWLSRRYLQGRLFRWLRLLVEPASVLWLTYWFLFAFIVYIDRPLTGSNPPDPASWVFRRHIGLYMLGTVFVYAILSGLNYYYQAQQKAALAEKLQQSFAQVRLQALRSQVNPHFLFNSLSVLSSLVHVDAALSEKFILQLSKAYRYILEQKDADMVSLKDELAFLDAYFFLLQIRFDKKIALVQHTGFDLALYRLPPLTLQLLVENAVKHNKMSAAEPLTITLHTENNSLVVENNHSPREQSEASTGVGLENIRNRYALLSDRKVLVEQDEKSFRVKVPLIKPAS